MKRWTVMVYMAGDNNLSEDMVAELKGMQAVMGQEGCDSNINIVAVYDSAYLTVDTAVYHFTQANSKKLLRDCQLQDVRKSALGPNPDAPRLKNFVELIASREDLNAEHYALIISGHSDGVLSRTMLRDSNPESIVTLSQLGYILDVSSKCLGEGRKFDLVGFDSCLMSMLEVGYELRSSAEVMVGSQGLTPSSGWPYNVILQPLVSRGGDMNPCEFATSIVRTFKDYSREFSIGGRSISISASLLKETEELKAAVDELGEFLSSILDWPTSPNKDYGEEDIAGLLVVRERIIDLIHVSHYNSQTFMQEQSVDIIDFAYNLSLRCEQVKAEVDILAGGNHLSAAAMRLWYVFDQIQSRCKAIFESCQRYVIANCYSGPDYQFSKGASVFFPWSYLAFNLVYKQYKKLKFNEGGAWREFIEKYTRQTVRPSIKEEEEINPNEDFVGWAASKESRIMIDPMRVESMRQWSGRQWSGRQWSGRQWSGKQWSGKSDIEEFFKQFGRFRNFPVFHDPDGCTR